MDKLKIKFNWSLVIIVVVCIFTNNFFVMTSYFIALILHELAHSAAARAKGYAFGVIDFNIFGMSLKLNNPVHQNDEFIINLAGPLCNVILCIICTSLWWIVPESYFFLLDFFNANLVLAVFNLLPIEPLDGSKLFASLLRNRISEKKANIIKKLLSLILSVVLIWFFLKLYRFKFSVFLIIVAIFLFLNIFQKKETDMEILTNFETQKLKKFYKTTIYYVSKECTLLELYKKITPARYVVFITYINNRQRIISEDYLRQLLIKYNFKCKIEHCFG